MPHIRPPLVVALLSLSLFAATASAASCDRGCLGSMITQFVDAVVAHDPSLLPLASHVRVVEDSQDAELGEGIWKTITDRTSFRLDYLDTRKQIAAAHLVLREGEVPVMLSVLLHVQDRKITGVETLVARSLPDSKLKPTEFDKPFDLFTAPVPAGQHDSRAAMIKTALTYTEGLRIGDLAKASTPFAPEAYRVENGAILAGRNCIMKDCEDILRQKMLLHPDIMASVAAVDEENATVLLWMNFGDTGTRGGKAIITFEAFKVWGGQIHAINAFFPYLAPTLKRNWPTSDPMPAR